MPRKKKQKIREIADTRFKEVKSNGKPEEKPESELERELSEGPSDFESSEFSSSGSSSPVLQSSNQTQDVNLEREAASAPSAAREDNALYEARTTAERGYGQNEYTRSNYETLKEQENPRASALLEDSSVLQRNMADAFLRKQQGAWTPQEDIRLLDANPRPIQVDTGYSPVEGGGRTQRITGGKRRTVD